MTRGAKSVTPSSRSKALTGPHNSSGSTGHAKLLAILRAPPKRGGPRMSKKLREAIIEASSSRLVMLDGSQLLNWADSLLQLRMRIQDAQTQIAEALRMMGELTEALKRQDPATISMRLALEEQEARYQSSELALLDMPTIYDK